MIMKIIMKQSILYEYLSENSKYYIYWVTNNDFLIKYLDKKRLKYITYKILLI